MNNLTRRFVYPSMLFAIAAFNAKAEPVGVHSVPELGTAVRPGLSNTDSVTDVTRSSFVVDIPAFRNISRAEPGHFQTYSFLNKDSDLWATTSWNGKVTPVENAPNTDRAVRPHPTVAGINSTDSLAGSGGTDTAATNSADQVVAEASAVVSERVDAGSLTIAAIITSSPAPSAGVSGAVASFNAPPPIISPEPSTLLLAGSLLVGFGMFRFSRSKVG
jgi:hypothetical protein